MLLIQFKISPLTSKAELIVCTRLRSLALAIIRLARDVIAFDFSSSYCVRIDLSGGTPGDWAGTKLGLITGDAPGRVPIDDWLGLLDKFVASGVVSVFKSGACFLEDAVVLLVACD